LNALVKEKDGPSSRLKGRKNMEMWKRVLLAGGILLVDTAVFFVPLTALFLAYILIFNPPWARSFLEGLEQKSK
jgi:hypothetical protein